MPQAMTSSNRVRMRSRVVLEWRRRDRRCAGLEVLDPRPTRSSRAPFRRLLSTSQSGGVCALTWHFGALTWHFSFVSYSRDSDEHARHGDPRGHAAHPAPFTKLLLYAEPTGEVKRSLGSMGAEIASAWTTSRAPCTVLRRPRSCSRRSRRNATSPRSPQGIP